MPVDLMMFDPRQQLAMLWYRRRLLVVTTVLAALAGIGVSRLVPPVYESEVTLACARNLGQPLQPADSLLTLTQTAGFQSQLSDAIRQFGPTVITAEVITAAPQSSDLLRIIGRGHSTDAAVEAAMVAANALLKRQTALFDAATREANEYRRTLKARFDAMVVEADDLQETLRPPAAARESALGVRMLLRERQDRILQVARELRDLGLQTATLTTAPAIIGSATVPQAPTWPRPAVFAVVAAAFGFALAVSFVLVAPLIGRQQAISEVRAAHRARV